MFGGYGRSMRLIATVIALLTVIVLLLPVH
jgi:hypothetical protein